MIDISDLDEADVLAALYNASRPLGMGSLQYTPEPMTRDEARALLSRHRSFDYLKGRVMKVRFFDPSWPEDANNAAGGLFGERLYDRDNGDGATARALESIRAKRAI